MTTIVAGMGEIGRVIAVMEKDKELYFYDPKYHHNEPPPIKADVLHICFPYGKDFIKSVVGYMLIHCPDITIIHSTVKVGTTAKIAKYGKVVHSPVRGTHPDIIQGLFVFDKYVSGPNESAKLAMARMKDMGLTCVWQGKDYRTTELAKLLDTTYYGWNIAFADMVGKLCKKLKLNYNQVYKEWNENYNVGYIMLGKENVVRPVLTPPEGGIGGHCVYENAALLNEPGLTEVITKMGKKK